MRKPNPRIPDNADDKDQSKRFIEAAREHETDDTGKTLEKEFRTISRTKPSPPKK